VIIKGKTFDLTKEAVEAAVAGLEPGPATTYTTVVAGRAYPVKQVLAVATGLNHRDFDSGRAQSVLSRLGFEILSSAPGARGRVSGSTRSFAGVEWGLAHSEQGYDEAPSGKLHLPGCAHGVTSPVRVWSSDEALSAWTSAPDLDLRTATNPGWCSDCAAIRGTTDPGLPAPASAPPVKTGRAERAAIALAARIVLDPGLRRRPSPFDVSTVTWTAENAVALRLAMDESGSSGTFRDRLAQQLAGLPRAVVLLAAELCFLQRLPLVNVRADTKRALVQDVLDVLDDRPQVPDDVHDALGTLGVFHGGQGFNQQIPQHVQWLCRFIEHWDSLDDVARADALGDPWFFREQTQEVSVDSSPMRNSLLALSWPSYFERIVSAADKKAIRDAFGALLPALTDDIDRDLLALRDRVDPAGDLDIDWYATPWRDEWRAPAPELRRRGWVLPSAGPGRAFVEAPVDLPVSDRSDRKAIRDASLAAWRGRPLPEVLTDIDATTDFAVTMRPGDQVFVKDDERVHVGVLGDLVAGRRPVEWRLAVPVTEVPRALLDLLEEGRPIAQTDYLAPDPVSPPVPSGALSLPRASTELSARLHYDKAWLDGVLDLLQDRRQIIFFGPPGTGKTFTARALADFVAPEGASRIVQFHPSYAYEDFFEGFRPAVDENGNATFRLAPGPVRLLAEAAAKNPSVPHILIIDEINRANIAKVFGELYLLLEYRDARVSLQYSPEEDFRLPENLFVVGTMNTADRSISLVDAAIRRRFSFVELHPSEDPVRGLLDRWSTARGHDISRGDLLRRLNERIGDLDRDFQVGPSYLMGAAARTPAGLARIWEHDILPLLDEHYYGRLTREEIRSTFGLAALEPSAWETHLDAALEP